MAALEIRQENILKQLAELKEQMLSLRSTLNVTTTASNVCLRNMDESSIVSSNEVYSSV